MVALMASWSPRSILIKTLAIQETGAMVVSGAYVWVKKDGIWWDTRSSYETNAMELAERLLWFKEKWGQPYALY